MKIDFLPVPTQRSVFRERIKKMTRLQQLSLKLLRLKVDREAISGRTSLSEASLLIVLCLSFAIVMFIGVSPGQSLAAERHCDAVYVWETTGGSRSGSFAAFKGKGKCGDSVPNRCRIRARNAVNQCIQVHWNKRWERTLPEACIQTSSDSTVVGYDLTLKCERLASSRKEECFVNGIVQNQSPPLATKVETIASRGDIKARLEGEVCCAFNNGNHKFSNLRDVHVSLKYRTRGNNHCPGSGVLSHDYKIDCHNVRKKFCRHQNLD